MCMCMRMRMCMRMCMCGSVDAYTYIHAFHPQEIDIAIILGHGQWQCWMPNSDSLSRIMHICILYIFLGQVVAFFVCMYICMYAM